MREIESGGGRGRAPAKRRAPQPAPHASPGPVGPLAPKARPTGVFAQPQPTAPNLGQQRAAARTQRARQRVAANTSVAVVPKIAAPTRAQRQTAKDLAIQSLAKQGIHTRADVNALPARERQRANRLLGYTRTQQKYEQAAVARRQPTRAPTALDRLSQSLQMPELSSVPQTLSQAALTGRQIGRARATPLATSRGDVSVGGGTLIPGLLRLPTINATALQRALASRVAGVTSLGAPSAENKFVGNALSDLLAVGSAPLVGGIAVGNAGYQAVRHGNLEAAKNLGSGIAKGISEDAAFKLLTGHPGQALEAFRAHPGFTALDIAGGVGLAGRLGAAVARGAGSEAGAAGLRGALARVGQDVRSPLALSTDAGAVRGGMVVERPGSRSMAGKGMQSVADTFRKPVVDEAGNIVTVDRGGRQIPVLQTSARGRDRLLKRDADFTAARANSVEHLAREVAAQEFHVRGIRGPAKDLVSMVVEGTITTAKHMRADLERERDRIQGHLDRQRAVDSGGTGESVYRHRGETAAAEARLKVVKKALASDKVMGNAEKIVEVGTALGHKLNASEAEAVRLGILDPKRARRSRLVVPAVAHMGARHFSPDEVKQLLGDERSVSGVVKAAKAARQEHHAAVVKVQQARAAHERARAVARARAQTRRAEIVPPGARRGTTRAARVSAFMDAAERHPRLKQMVEADRRDQKMVAERKAELDKAIKAERDARGARTTAEQKAATLPTGITDKALKHGALRGHDGRFLSNKDIEKVLADRGRDPHSVAYLPHRLDVRGARAFHTQFRPGSRPTIDKPGTRTGSAYEKGVTEASPDLIHEQGARLGTQTAKAQQVDRLISDRGIKKPDGTHFTGKEAKEYADRILHDTGEVLVPVAAFPAKASKGAQARALAAQDSSQMESLHLKLLNDRVKDADREGAKNVVLVPEATINRLVKHLQPAGDIMRTLQYMNRAFRNAVLPQPRWLTGNFVEPFLVRLPVAGSGLTNIPGLALDITASRRILRKMERSGDPREVAAAAEIRAQQLGGLFVGRRGASVRRTADDLPGVLKHGAMIRQLPVVKQAADLVNTLLQGFFKVNRVIESTAQKAAFGQAARHEIQAFTGSWLQTVRLGKAAVAEAARGLTDTPTQARFMRAQHELLGQYEGFSPMMRQVIQGPAPFLPWSLAAARFVFWTMPVKHPLVTSLLVKAQQVVQPEQDKSHADVPPGGLRAAVRRKDGGLVDVGRYTPYGLTQPIVQGDLAGLTDSLLPQTSGFIHALHGQNPFGRDLQVQKTADNPQGKASGGQKAGIAINSLAEALVPYLAIARRLQEHGETATSDSTVFAPRTKPGTSHGMSAVDRTFNPFRPTYISGSGGGGQAASAGPVGGVAGFLQRSGSGPVSAASVSSDQEFLLRAMSGR